MFILNGLVNPRSGQRVEIRDAKGNFANNPVNFIPNAPQTVLETTDVIFDFPFLAPPLLFDENDQDWGI